jgi:hypothetical protein
MVPVGPVARVGLVVPVGLMVPVVVAVGRGRPGSGIP